jgi:antirestriction protein ArdC
MNTLKQSGVSSTEGTARADVYARVTERIVCALEDGTRPWVKPWSGGQAAPLAMPQRHNGVPYRGINVVLLWGEAIEHGWGRAGHCTDPGAWVTSLPLSP